MQTSMQKKCKKNMQKICKHAKKYAQHAKQNMQQICNEK